MALNLSEHEQRHVAALKKRRDQWPSLRWPLLVLVAANLSIAAAGFSNHGWSAMPLIYLLVSAGVAVKLYRDWHGSATTTLLLRLLDRDAKGEA